MDKKTDKIEKVLDITKIIENEDVPKIYANSFACFQGNADMGIVLQQNGQPTAVINLSFTLAKTLAEKLNQMLLEFEDTTNNQIMTTTMIDAKIYDSIKKQ